MSAADTTNSPLPLAAGTDKGEEEASKTKAADKSSSTNCQKPSIVTSALSSGSIKIRSSP